MRFTPSFVASVFGTALLLAQAGPAGAQAQPKKDAAPPDQPPAMSEVPGKDEAARRPLSSREAYQQTLRATAWVVIPNKSKGSGWVVSVKDRLVVTNFHVVTNNDTAVVSFPEFRDGQVVAERLHYERKLNQGQRGKVLLSDSRRDLAVIQLESLPEGVRELKLAATSGGPADPIHSVGNPGISDALWVYASGTIRQIYRRELVFEDQKVVARVVETQVPLNQGDSGGPAVNEYGELVGVTAATSTKAQGFSVLIDVSEVKEFLDELPRLTRPQSADDFMRVAALAYNKRQFDQAIQAYGEAIKQDANSAQAHRNRGVAFFRRNDFQRAVDDCTKAIQLRPDDAYAFLWRARAHRQLGNETQARADEASANRLQPGIK